MVYKKEGETSSLPLSIRKQFSFDQFSKKDAEKSVYIMKAFSAERSAIDVFPIN